MLEGRALQAAIGKASEQKEGRQSGWEGRTESEGAGTDADGRTEEGRRESESAGLAGGLRDGEEDDEDVRCADDEVVNMRSRR